MTSSSSGLLLVSVEEPSSIGVVVLAPALEVAVLGVPVAASVISCLMPSTTCDIRPRISADVELTDAGSVVLRSSTFFVMDSIAVECSC